ncbi:MAG: hypothetical protein JWQ96_961, partial [Segetibacter sp.]|nr:hypothetical protein [Segetibacter sp.]
HLIELKVIITLNSITELINTYSNDDALKNQCWKHYPFFIIAYKTARQLCLMHKCLPLPHEFS